MLWARACDSSLFVSFLIGSCFGFSPMACGCLDSTNSTVLFILPDMFVDPI